MAVGEAFEGCAPFSADAAIVATLIPNDGASRTGFAAHSLSRGPNLATTAPMSLTTTHADAASNMAVQRPSGVDAR